jgi:hypothetical protein
MQLLENQEAKCSSRRSPGSVLSPCFPCPSLQEHRRAAGQGLNLENLLTVKVSENGNQLYVATCANVNGDFSQTLCQGNGYSPPVADPGQKLTVGTLYGKT